MIIVYRTNMANVRFVLNIVKIIKIVSKLVKLHRKENFME